MILSGEVVQVTATIPREYETVVANLLQLLSRPMPAGTRVRGVVVAGGIIGSKVGTARAMAQAHSFDPHDDPQAVWEGLGVAAGMAEAQAMLLVCNSSSGPEVLNECRRLFDSGRANSLGTAVSGGCHMATDIDELYGD
jgi:hypothetical protein